MKEISSERILIKKKNKYFKVIIKIIFLIVIVVFTAMVSTKVAVKEFMKNISNYSDIDKSYDADEMFTKAITKVSHSVVTIGESKDNLNVNTNVYGNVSGIIIDNKGYIVTSFSKVKGMKNIFIKFPSLAKEPIQGSLIGADENTDVALIKVKTDGLTAIEINKTDDIKEGKVVIAAGNTISNDFIGMATSGIVTAVNESIYDELKNNSYKVIQTNSVINDSNVGGPLCNTEGELIGFNSSTLNSDNDKQLYYSLSSAGLVKVVEYLIGLIDKLGIGGKLIDDKESKVRGLYIENITANGYAARAGLLPTDIILSVNGREIVSLEDINEVINEKENGEDIQCEILRDGIKTSVLIPFN